MRNAPAVLVAFLASRANFISADLFTITLQNGDVYAWTSYDQDLRVAPYLYSAMGPLIDRTKWDVKNTIDVPEMEIKIYTNGSDMPDGSNLKLLVHNGFFDYATVKLSRVFMPTPGDTSLGSVDIFLGDVAQLSIEATGITMTVKGANTALAQYMPRNQYMLGCNHSLYDTGCAPNPGQPGGGPSRAANTFPNTVGAGSSVFMINWGEAPPANVGNFAKGYVTFTSGVNEGIQRSITLSNSTNFALAYPLYQPPAEGDTFTVTYGCQKTQSSTNGCNFFGNIAHYMGFPFVPPAEYGL